MISLLEYSSKEQILMLDTAHTEINSNPFEPDSGSAYITTKSGTRLIIYFGPDEYDHQPEARITALVKRQELPITLIAEKVWVPFETAISWLQYGLANDAKETKTYIVVQYKSHQNGGRKVLGSVEAVNRKDAISLAQTKFQLNDSLFTEYLPPSKWKANDEQEATMIERYYVEYFENHI